MYGLDFETYNLLKESSVLMDEWSNDMCKHKHKGGMEEWAKNNTDEKVIEDFSCDWYHGTWQYMRLLNMVAVPNWYGFYVDALSKALENNKNANVFISACADYGMLAKLHEAIKNTGANPTITIYDICKTPLKSSEWYANKFGLEVKCKVSNIIYDEIPEAPFDIIVTDEFLSVLKKEYKPQITKKWKEILKPGGQIITTAMIGKPTERENREYYFKKAENLIKMYDSMLFPEKFLNGYKDKFMQKIKDFADFHTRHMIVDEKEINDLFKDFNNFKYTVIRTPGECINPTDSFQIVASYN